MQPHYLPAVFLMAASYRDRSMTSSYRTLRKPGHTILPIDSHGNRRICDEHLRKRAHRRAAANRAKRRLAETGAC